MSRIQPIDRATTDDRLHKTFDAVEKKLGVVPTMVRTMAVSPAVLDAYLGLDAALGRGALSTALRERIALATAEANACDYCLSAHTALGRRAGVPEGELDASRAGLSSDPKVAAALRFVSTVLDRRGGVSDVALADVRAAGFSDGDVAELVANVALNVFTNYFNRVARTEIDFPRVTARSTVAA